MEENQYYKSIQSIIHKLDVQVKNISVLLLKKDFSLMRREIEEHFERAIHALEARERLLLDQLDLISQQQESLFLKLNANLNERREKCKEIEQAGAIAYKLNKASADLLWQEALKLVAGPIDTSALQLRVTVDVPMELLENINTHGKVESAADPNYEAIITSMASEASKNTGLVGKNSSAGSSSSSSTKTSEPMDITQIKTNIDNIVNMVFSGEVESKVMDMCQFVGEQIEGLAGDVTELAPKTRFFNWGIKEAISARSGSTLEVTIAKQKLIVVVESLKEALEKGK